MSVHGRRFRSLVFGAVVGLGFGLAMGAAIGVGLAALADLWFPSILFLVAAAVGYELWRFRQKPRPSNDTQVTAGRGRIRVPLLLFGGCVAGGALGVAIAAVRGSIDASAIAILIGIVIGAALPTFVDLSRTRRET
jgi:uncharacterized membrane protein YedE/YeeE